MTYEQSIRAYGPVSCVTTDEFGRTMYLFNLGRTKINAMKVIREHTNRQMGLRAIKDFVESLPRVGQMSIYYPEV